MKKNTVNHEKHLTTIGAQARKLDELLQKSMDSTPKSEHQTLYQLNQYIRPILAACEAQYPYRMYTEGIKSIIFSIDDLRTFVKKHATLDVMEEVDNLTLLTQKWMCEVFSEWEVEQYFRVAEIENLAHSFSDAISFLDEDVAPELFKQIHFSPMPLKKPTTPFQSVGTELVQLCTNLKSVILATMPMYGPALQQSYNFNLVRLDRFVGLLHKHCDKKLPPDANEVLTQITDRLQSLTQDRLQEWREQAKEFDEGSQICTICQSPNLSQKTDQGLLITYCTECNHEVIFESTYSMRRRFITLPEDHVLFQVIVSDGQEEFYSLEQALLNRNRMHSIVKLEGDMKTRILEYNSFIASLNEWLKSMLFNQIIGKTLDEVKEYFKPIFEQVRQEAKDGHKEFIRKMIFEDQFAERIDVNLSDDAPPEELEIYKELSDEYKDERIRIHQKKSKKKESSNEEKT